MQMPGIEQNPRDNSISSIPAIYYPESDGKPLAESDAHLSAIAHLREALRFFFRQHTNVYTSACLFFYYAEGNPTLFTVPNIFVVKGVAKHARRIYKLWEEKFAPCVVIEITSSATREEDNVEKKELYQALGVREYFLFDPLEEYLKPCLQGLQLRGDYYEPMPLTKDGTLMSQELDIMLRPIKALLRVVDPMTGVVVPTLEETADILDAQKRTKIAEVEIARLRAEIEQLKSQQTD